MIGINDVQAVVQTDGRSPSTDGSDGLAQFRRNLEQIVVLAQSETSAQIALLSIPPLGEDLSSTPNLIIGRYNKVVEDLCRTRHLTYLPLNERLSDVLHDRDGVDGRRTILQRSGNLSTKVALRHYFLRQNWDTISKLYGFSVHTDGIHLNSKGATAVANLIEVRLTTISDRDGTHQ